MRIPKVWMYVKFFSRVDRKSRPWHLILLVPYCVTESIFKGMNPVKFVKQFRQQFRAISLPTTQLEATQTIPEIEILCVAAGKDIELLPIVISQAVKCSINPIIKITVITRGTDLKYCISVLQSLEIGISYEVMDEDQRIPEPVRKELKRTFTNRYGWVLQQLLAVEYILDSRAEGVLLINADTILLRKKLWLNSQREQIMMPSVEFHPPYYNLLSKIIGSSKNPRFTFVSHHMLFQPEILREIFIHWDLGSIPKFVQNVIKNSDPDEQSPMCIEFELYAQGISTLHPDLIKLKKFANTTWKRNSITIEDVKRLTRNPETSPFNSISLHDYA